MAGRRRRVARRPYRCGQADGAVGVEILTTPDLLGFAGITPIAVPTIPIVVLVAEKLHAYTRVYHGGRASSRVKYLVDLALIAHLFPLDAAELWRAIDDVFAARATHEIPTTVPSPPDQWRVPFRRMASAVGLDGDIDTGHRRVAAMLDPIFDHHLQNRVWDPNAQQWMDIVTP